jgi:hypothetical protein
MNFEEAKVLMLSGKRVRRRAWRRGASISYKEGDQFITLTVHFEVLGKDDITKKWNPYVDDFIENDWENDWEICPDFVPKISSPVKRVSRYNREPVI